MAANRWNSFHITAEGLRLVVVFDGKQTVDVQNDKFCSSLIAPQSAGGTIRLRKVQVRSI